MACVASKSEHGDCRLLALRLIYAKRMPPKKQKTSDFTPEDPAAMTLRKFRDSLDPKDPETPALQERLSSVITHHKVRCQSFTFSTNNPIDSVQLGTHTFSLQLKDDNARARARQQGALEIEGNVVTSAMTKQLISSACQHVVRPSYFWPLNLSFSLVLSAPSWMPDANRSDITPSGFPSQ